MWLNKGILDSRYSRYSKSKDSQMSLMICKDIKHNFSQRWLEMLMVLCDLNCLREMHDLSTNLF